MEYSEWAKWEKEYPWLWRIVYNGHFEYRDIACKRANHKIPFNRLKPFPDSRVWVASGSRMGRLKRPRVFRVEEIEWDAPGITLHQQTGISRWRSGLDCLYVVVGTVRPDPEGEDLTIYKRPHGVEDFRSLLY